jgi:hypothetical protein
METHLRFFSASYHRLRCRQNEPSVQETRDLERYDSLPSPTLALGPILFLVLLFSHHPLQRVLRVPQRQLEHLGFLRQLYQ